MANRNNHTKLYMAAMSSVQHFPIDGKWLSLSEITTITTSMGLQLVSDSTPITAFKALASEGRWECNNSHSKHERKYRPTVPAVDLVPLQPASDRDQSLVDSAYISKIADRVEKMGSEQARLITMLEALCGQLGIKTPA